MEIAQKLALKHDHNKFLEYTYSLLL